MNITEFTHLVVTFYLALSKELLSMYKETYKVVEYFKVNTFVDVY